MTREVLKQALEALEKNYKLINGEGTRFGLEGAMDGYYSGCFDVDGTNKETENAIASLRQAIKELESQERNFCPRCGKRTNDIHTCTPPQRTEQDPVKLPCCGYTDASAVKWNPFNRVVQCHNCGQTYTQPQRTWVGLTPEEFHEACWESYVDPVTGECSTGDREYAVRWTEAKLKQKNGFAEENT